MSRPLAVMLACVLACVMCMGVMPTPNATAAEGNPWSENENQDWLAADAAYQRAKSDYLSARSAADKAALAAAGSVGASTAYMATTEGRTSLGYFKSRGATGAYRVLTDPDVTYRKYLDHVRVGDDRDATSFRMVRYALKHLEEYEAILKSPDHYIKATSHEEAPVSDTLMAMGEVNADWEAFCTASDAETQKANNNCYHTRQYSPTENLLTNGDTPDKSPYKMLYYDERDLWESLQRGEVSLSDIPNPDDMLGHWGAVEGSGGDLTGAGIANSANEGYGNDTHFAQEFEDNDGNSRNCATQTQVVGCGRIMSLKDWEADFEKYVAQTDDAMKKVKASNPKAKAAFDDMDAKRKAVDTAKAARDRVGGAEWLTEVRSVDAPEGVSTVQGVKPVLPDTVGVTLNSTAVENRGVSWDAVPAASYTKPGAFTVRGRVAGWSEPVSVRVTVTAASKPSKPSTEPSKPNTQPSTPGTPGTQPSKPSTQPSTQPSSEPSKPSKPSTKPSKPSTPTTQPSKPSASSTVTMWRLYNPNSGEHFYTGNAKERDMLVRIGWKSEGEGWTAPTSGDPVYRLYNPNAGDHHYTLNPGERDMLVKVGWTYEGVGWHSATASDTDRKPLYRQYNPNAVAGAHNYTLSKAENDHLARIGWCAEGLAWYAV